MEPAGTGKVGLEKDSSHPQAQVIGTKLHQRRFRLDIRKHFLTVRMSDVAVLLRWAVKLHHGHTLIPPPQVERGSKYDEKGSRVEIRTGGSLNNYRDGQNSLRVGRQ